MANRRHGIGALAPSRCSRWALWQLPRPVLAYVLTVEAAVVAVAVVLSSRAQADAGDVRLCAALIAVAVVTAELSKRIERLRKLISPHVNMTSTWCFAAAMLLPPQLVVVVVAAIGAHLWRRSWAHVPGLHAHRAVFNSVNALASCLAAVAVRETWWPDAAVGTGSAGLLAAAIAAYAVTNAALVAIVIGLSSHRWTINSLLGELPENVLEFATLCLGAVTAVLLTENPLLVGLLLPAFPVLHRAMLVRHLEDAALTDGKTGLLNAQTWHRMAAHELEQAGRAPEPVGLLMIDIDHFKRVNDTHGHLVGDAALKAVADALRDEMRAQDRLCRFGGEEFVVLLPGVSGRDVLAVAERLRARVADVVVTSGEATVGGLTISVGAAVFPDTAPDLDGLLLAADNALFAAKNGGRNQVRLTGAPLGT